jgi:hypothetical protein
MLQCIHGDLRRAAANAELVRNKRIRGGVSQPAAPVQPSIQALFQQMKAEKERLNEDRQELDEPQSPELVMQDGSSGVQQSAGRRREVTPGPEALSSGGEPPAGTVTAERQQADDKAEPSKASVLQSIGCSLYTAVTRRLTADLMRRGYTAAVLKR